MIAVSPGRLDLSILCGSEGLELGANPDSMLAVHVQHEAGARIGGDTAYEIAEYVVRGGIKQSQSGPPLRPNSED